LGTILQTSRPKFYIWGGMEEYWEILFYILTIMEQISASNPGLMGGNHYIILPMELKNVLIYLPYKRVLFSDNGIKP